MFKVAIGFIAGVVVGLLAGSWTGCHNMPQFLANCATVLAAVVGLPLALATLWNSVSIRRAELILKIYNTFLDEPLYSFYARICDGEAINWRASTRYGHLLNKCLTLFDEVNYLRNQWVLWQLCDKRVWEYIASEVQAFASNVAAWDYIKERFDEDTGKGLPRNAIPFTGFPELLSKIPRAYRARNYPCVPDKYKSFYKHLTS